MKIGAHISIAKGFEKAAKEVVKMGGNTFQFFTRNPRGGKAKKIDLDDINKAVSLMEKNNISNPLAHAPYTLNLCSATERVRDFGLEMLKDDLIRMKSLPSKYYNFHPGSHTGNGIEKGIELIVDSLNEAMYEGMETIVLLETMSGKGTEIGSKFEELKKIIDGIKLKENIGVCLDTCHIFSAGYDIVNNLDDVLEEFDRIIGLDKLKTIHLNDSLKPLGSNKDRHAKIGEGLIGEEAIVNIINNKYLKEKLFYLETPNDNEGYKREIEFLKGKSI